MEIIKKEVKVTKFVSELKEVERYVCEDGREFKNKELAEEWETKLKKDKPLKEKIKFTSITPLKYDKPVSIFSNSPNNPNELYEPEFCFYYHSGLSKEVKVYITNLVFNLSLSNVNKMKDGWYYCNQEIYMFDDGGDNDGQLGGDCLFYLIEDRIVGLKDEISDCEELLFRLNMNSSKICVLPEFIDNKLEHNGTTGKA